MSIVYSQVDSVPPRDAVIRVEAYLRDAALKLRQGDRLPSARSVMRQCGVGQRVFVRALERLQQEGMIEVRSRSGIYRAAGSAAATQMIDYLYFGQDQLSHSDSFTVAAIEAVAGRLTRRGYYLRMHVMPDHDNPERLIRELAATPNACVLTHSISLADLPMLAPLLHADVPCVHVFPNTLDSVHPMVAIRDADCVKAQLEHLTGLGHKRIGYLHGARDDAFIRPAHARRDAFCRLAIEFGLNIDARWIRYVGFDHGQTIRRETRELMNLPEDCRPTALIIYDIHVRFVYEALREVGLLPGRDIAVVGANNSPWTAQIDPPLTTVRISGAEAAREAEQMFDEIRAGEDPANRYLKLELITRASSAGTAQHERPSLSSPKPEQQIHRPISR